MLSCGESWSLRLRIRYHNHDPRLHLCPRRNVCPFGGSMITFGHAMHTRFRNLLDESASSGGSLFSSQMSFCSSMPQAPAHVSITTCLLGRLVHVVYPMLFGVLTCTAVLLGNDRTPPPPTMLYKYLTFNQILSNVESSVHLLRVATRVPQRKERKVNSLY